MTGASSGIGRAIARRFAKEGAQVALVARREEQLKELQKEIEKNGGKAQTFVADLSETCAITEVFSRIRKTIGDPQILVNNAGVGFPGKVVDLNLEDYEKTFAVNFRAVYVASKEVLPAMIKAKEGTIINIGSIAGKIGMANSSLYSASKFAVTGFSEALLEEVREHNVRVSLICPGRVHTELFGNKSSFSGKIENYIQPEDIAEAALLCASDTQSATYSEIIVRPRRPVW